MLFFQSVLLLVIANCRAFNIDTNNPIVYEDPFKSANLNESSYFGYSLVLYPGDNTKAPWVFIGTPRGLNRRGKSTGVCVKCGIAEKCAVIDINEISKISDSSRTFEILDKAWIGASMDINYDSKRIVTCAPRWIRIKTSSRKDEDYRMQGACYWFHTEDNDVQKILPLMSKNLDTDSRGGRSVYFYGQGQSGFSTHLPKRENQLVLGAPGVYNWDGTSILYTDGVDSPPIASRIRWSRDAEPNEFSLKNIASAIETKETFAYDLLGYSTTSGYFYNRSKLFYVSGAPRTSYNGQILIYTFSQKNDEQLYVKETKRGQQFGEYFGGSLTAGDINNDGLDDLIVGAPFYQGKIYNQGKIYIYLGSSSGRLREPTISSIIGQSTSGQFGTTVQYLGDINHDRFGDVAVAAPYEEDHSGVIYLHQGTRDGLNPEFSQRIVGKDIHQNIRGFGMSISKAVDMDANTYSDVAVGAYLSGHVVLLRSHPVITTYQKLSYFPTHLKPEATSFLIEECFWYTLDYRDPNEIISVQRSLQVDQQLGRAFLETDLEAVVQLPDGGTCRNLTVKLTKSFSNRYSPITVTLTHRFLEKPESKQIVFVSNDIRGIDNFSPRTLVHDKLGSKLAETVQIPFALGCKTNICKSKLKIVPKIIGLEDDTFVLGSRPNLELQIDLGNTGEKAYLAQLLVALPDIVTFGSIPSQCSEKNSSSVVCSVDNPLDTDKQRSIKLDLDMSNVNSGQFDNSLTFTVEATTSSENSGDESKEIVLKLKREADVTIMGKSQEQSYSYRNISEGKSNFTQVYQIETFGSSPLNAILIEINIPHFMQMSDGSKVNFTGLYRPTAYMGNQDVNCQSDFSYIKEAEISDNFLNLEDTEQKSKPRSRRSVMEVEVFNKSRAVRARIRENEFEDFQNRTFYINCSMPQVFCSKITCTAGPIRAGQSVKIRLPMIFDVASIKGFLGKKDVVLFATQGRVSVTNPASFVQTGDKPDSVEVASLFVGNSQPEIVALWIIILSVVAGLLLLFLLIFGLIKLGFFKRTAKEELEQLKKEIEYNDSTDLVAQEPQEEINE